MILLFLFFALPVIASYLTYYVIKPQGRTNYGDLIQPQLDVRGLVLRKSQPGDATTRTAPGLSVGDAPTLGKVPALQQKWQMVSIGPAACDEACSKRLYYVRQVRKTTGKDMDRIERVWLVTDEAKLDGKLIAEHEGLNVLRVDETAVRGLFSAPSGSGLSDHVYLIDPLGNLMMRFPKDADPSKMKKDLLKLLKASRIG
jgi:hypothetical protein